jgi:hypothetical protein
VRNADALGDISCVVDVLPGATGALAMGSRTVIVKLQRDADDVVTLGFQQRGRRRGIDTTGHGDDDPCVLWTAFKIQTVEHGSVIAAIAAASTLRDAGLRLKSPIATRMPL